MVFLVILRVKGIVGILTIVILKVRQAFNRGQRFRPVM
jgi:hypothetical protein